MNAFFKTKIVENEPNKNSLTFVTLLPINTIIKI